MVREVQRTGRERVVCGDAGVSGPGVLDYGAEVFYVYYDSELVLDFDGFEFFHFDGYRCVEGFLEELWSC